MSHILLAEHPEHDANERVGLLTVIAGLRPVALFLDIEQVNARRLGRLVRPNHLIPIFTRGPRVADTEMSSHPPEVTRLFRNSDESLGLWVCRNSEHLSAIKKGVDQPTAAAMLGYPQCCTEAHQQEQADFLVAVIGAYIQSFGNDPQKIAQALLQNRKVQMEWEDDHRISRTMATFPFVQHIACEACLTSQSSPTAGLNSQYQELIADTDRMLHNYLLRVAKRREKEMSEGTCTRIDLLPPGL